MTDTYKTIMQTIKLIIIDEDELLYMHGCKDKYVTVIFGGQNIRGSAILIHFVGNIFVVAAWFVGKGRQGCFIRK